MADRPIILVGGGTGGHIFPLIAVAEELSSRKVSFIYVGSKDSLEEKVVAAHGWPFMAIEAGKWRRYLTFASILSNIIDVFKAVKGFFQSVKLLRKSRARLVISKGGFVAMPLLYAARAVGCPVIVHESDAVMGIANRIGSRFAKRVLTAFDISHFPSSDSRYIKVGIPLRRNLRQAARLKSPRKVRPVVLILPGSQGSAAINQYVKESLNVLLNFCDIVHLTGEKDYAAFEALRQQLSKTQSERYRPYKFIDRELPYYYQSADLIVARSSATIAAEAALFAKALYMIPLPESANSHQQINAQLLEKAGAAVVRQQYQLSAEQFVTDVNNLLKDKERLEKMGKALSEYFASHNAVSKVLEEIKHASAN
jgi:UDP-N-acetylglucosamine--N-acetylmuramyl-(pentapeptide) pyrophosphoryl-undecaprenol N-acetylglucosamine transferase